MFKQHMHEWRQAFSSLFFPEPPACVLCGKKIYREYFMEYSLIDSEMDSTDDANEDSNDRLVDGSCDGSEDDARNKLASRIQKRKLTSADRRFQERLRVAISHQVCLPCYRNFRFLFSPLCERCGKSLGTNRQSCDDYLYCDDCGQNAQNRQQTRYFHSNRSIAEYKSIKEVIQRFKYNGQRNLAPLLSMMMLEGYYRHYRDREINLIVPVPLHDARLAERGFNQASLLAEQISKQTGIEVNEMLIRAENTLKQSKKSKWERTRISDTAFAVKKTDFPASIKHVLLVDDIYTTGTTADMCAKELKESGVNEVYVLTLAR